MRATARAARALGWLAVAAAAAAVGCTTARTPALPVAPASLPTRPPTGPQSSEIAYSLFLIGDAGAPADTEPVLVALARAAAAAPRHRAIVYLGDNVYPRGLPDTGALVIPTRKETERRLQAQIDVARLTHTPTWFIPGNHDWGYMTDAGWQAIVRQSLFIDAHGGGWATMQPRGGCPGPVAVDLSPGLRLIMLDTQWWVHDYQRPIGDDSPCRYATRTEVVRGLYRLIRTAGHRRVVVAGHHPLATGGEHGGNVPLIEHLFPLLAFKPWLYVPLPVVGSYYVLNRQQGTSNQDIAGPKYVQMRQALERVFAKAPPLLYVSGHDHDLQVLKGRYAHYLAVSGAGIHNHEGAVRPILGDYYSSSEAGFMRLDLLRDGRARLSVVTVDGDANATEAFALMLE